MEVGKNAKWLVPFVVDVSSLIKNMGKLEKLDFLMPPKNVFKAYHGVTVHDLWNKKYRIKIHSHYTRLVRKNPFEFSFKPYTTMDTMVCLAHELAHLDHWEHTIEHKTLENSIMVCFLSRLKSMGYVSEEHEEKNGFLVDSN